MCRLQPDVRRQVEHMPQLRVSGDIMCDCSGAATHATTHATTDEPGGSQLQNVAHLLLYCRCSRLCRGNIRGNILQPIFDAVCDLPLMFTDGWGPVGSRRSSYRPWHFNQVRCLSPRCDVCIAANIMRAALPFAHTAAQRRAMCNYHARRGIIPHFTTRPNRPQGRDALFSRFCCQRFSA